MKRHFFAKRTEVCVQDYSCIKTNSFAYQIFTVTTTGLTTGLIFSVSSYIFNFSYFPRLQVHCTMQTKRFTHAEYCRLTDIISCRLESRNEILRSKKHASPCKWYCMTSLQRHSQSSPRSSYSLLFPDTVYEPDGNVHMTLSRLHGHSTPVTF